MATPQDYNLPHDEFRPHQEETIESVLNNSHYQVHILESAVGSGKTAYAAALGSQGRSAMSLVKTIALQEQYKDLYGFDTLMGMARYPCALNPMLAADHCVHMSSMYDCPVSAQCHYLISREVFQRSARRCTNYYYFLRCPWMRQHAVNYIIGDECHRIPEILEDHLSISMSVEDCYKLDVPIFPTTDVSILKVRQNLFLDWAEKVLTNLHYNKGKLEAISENNPDVIRKIAQIDSAISKFDTAVIGIEDEPDNWYCWWSEDEIRVTPLSVSDYFSDHFVRGFANNLLLMSATVGNPEIFSRLIGIDGYYYHNVPSVFSPEERAVHVMVNCPSINYRSSELEKDKQADEIAKAIKDQNPDWPFLIHTQSYAKQKELAERFAHRGLQDRVFTPQGSSTGDKLRSAKMAVKRYGNPVTITVSLEEGVDLPEYKGNIVANMPWPYIGNDLGRARMESDRGYYMWKTGIGLQQMLGRNRRGHPSQYGDNSFCAVADMGIQHVSGMLSERFKESLVEWS